MQPTGLETRRLTAKLGPTCVGESPRLSTLTYRRSKNTSIPLPPGVCGKAYRPSQTSNHPVLCPHTALPPSLTSSTTFLLALTGETRRSPLRVDLPPDELLLSLSTPYVCAPQYTEGRWPRWNSWLCTQSLCRAAGQGLHGQTFSMCP